MKHQYELILGLLLIMGTWLTLEVTIGGWEYYVGFIAGLVLGFIWALIMNRGQ